VVTQTVGMTNAGATEILVHDRHAALLARAEQHRLAAGHRHRRALRLRVGSLLVGAGVRLARPYEVRLAARRSDGWNGGEEYGLVVRAHP
jgi:hypothetical protein